MAFLLFLSRVYLCVNTITLFRSSTHHWLRPIEMHFYSHLTELLITRCVRVVERDERPKRLRFKV